MVETSFSPPRSPGGRLSSDKGDSDQRVPDPVRKKKKKKTKLAPILPQDRVKVGPKKST